MLCLPPVALAFSAHSDGAGDLLRLIVRLGVLEDIERNALSKLRHFFRLRSDNVGETLIFDYFQFKVTMAYRTVCDLETKIE